ncbi:oxysterol-binding protein [Elysia marginata]|uniref:Oxysterol-binding protein n=1 Tax=Elysia marginata TaxID=1093978 RepID=A0AAV4EI68_9GAST|nr:oxysterol-binding protein [Elysia marginata]
MEIIKISHQEFSRYVDKIWNKREDIGRLSDVIASDRSPLPPGSKLSKRESLKEKKKSYRSQKKEVAREVMNSASDKSIVLMADWLKVRGTLKGWTKLWCVCRPAMLVIYKSEKMKTGHWVGTILLSTCQLLQRPSKKEGYCFKLFHPLDQSIWATKGPKGETIGAFVQPLPMSYAIFRAPSESQGKCWMDALELALLRCTSLIRRTVSRTSDLTTAVSGAGGGNGVSPGGGASVDQLLAAEQAIQMKAAISPELSASLVDHDTEDSRDERDGEECGEEEAEVEVTPEHYSDDDDHSSIGLSDSDFELAEEGSKRSDIPQVEETLYKSDEVEELGQQGDACQTEEVNEENKSLIWTLVKQVRPGMDLSKVVLPTFILEPRSFLDKLTDYYYHADILSQAVQQETALERMKMVVKWYLSGFYKKPKGLKKPYNPIIGETFRCCWVHPETKSRTFYVAEQISHHPPVSAFHVTNRQDGFNINGCILAKSKFYGNSISAILDGIATLTFLERGEDYYITMPYAHCKGILVGTLTMEMGGKVTLDCPKTGYHCDLDFKLKPFFGNGESANRITGRIRMGSEVLCSFEGHWDQQVYIKEFTNRERVLFWDPSSSMRAKRLVRCRVPLDLQEENESERLWKKVSDAVVNQDMHTATAEKYVLEERQRQEAKERNRVQQDWVPKLFTLEPSSGKWVYKYVDARPWDSMTDCIQYEKDHVICTQTVHTVSPVRQTGWQGPRTRQKQTSTGSPPGTPSSTTLSTTSASRPGRWKPRVTGRQKNNNEDEDGSSTDCSDRVTSMDEVTAAKRQQHRLKFSASNGLPLDDSPRSSQSEQKHVDQIVSRTMSALHSSSPPKLSGVNSSIGKPGGNAVLSQSQHPSSSSYSHHHRHGTPGTSSSQSHNQKQSPSREVATLARVVQMQQEMQVAVQDLVGRVAQVQKAVLGQGGEVDSQGQGEGSRLQYQRTSGDGAGVGVSGPTRQTTEGLGLSREWLLISVVLVFQTFLQWYFSH